MYLPGWYTFLVALVRYHSFQALLAYFLDFDTVFGTENGSRSKTIIFNWKKHRAKNKNEKPPNQERKSLTESYAWVRTMKNDFFKQGAVKINCCG